LPQLRERKNKIAETWERFNVIQTEIEEIEENIDPTNEQDQFEALTYRTGQNIQDWLIAVVGIETRVE